MPDQRTRGHYDDLVQTQVRIHDGWLKVLIECDGPFPQAAVHFETDPVTQVRSITVFSDDGRGNGLPILSFPID